MVVKEFKPILVYKFFFYRIDYHNDIFFSYASEFLCNYNISTFSSNNRYNFFRREIFHQTEIFNEDFFFDDEKDSAYLDLRYIEYYR